MSATIFTPGEWKVHAGTLASAVAVYCAAGNICTLRHRRQSRYVKARDRDQTICDANLIAAAPELYEALDRLLNADAENIADVIAAEEFARAALAKATQP